MKVKVNGATISGGAVIMGSILMACALSMPAQNLTVIRYSKNGITTEYDGYNDVLPESAKDGVPTQTDLVGYKPATNSNTEKIPETSKDTEYIIEEGEEILTSDAPEMAEESSNDTSVDYNTIADKRWASGRTSPALSDTLYSKTEFFENLRKNASLPDITFSTLYNSVCSYDGNDCLLAIAEPTTTYRPDSNTMLTSTNDITVISEVISNNVNTQDLIRSFDDLIITINGDGAGLEGSEGVDTLDYMSSITAELVEQLNKTENEEEEIAGLEENVDSNEDNVEYPTIMIGANGFIENATEGINGRTLWYTSLSDSIGIIIYTTKYGGFSAVQLVNDGTNMVRTTVNSYIGTESAEKSVTDFLTYFGLNFEDVQKALEIFRNGVLTE